MLHEQWIEAYSILTTLGEQYPDEKRVWILLSEVCMQLEDMRGHQRTLENWLRLDPENGDVLYGLGAVYVLNQHPMLALEMFRRALKCELDDEQTAHIEEGMPVLEAFAQEAEANFAGIGDDWRELAVLHERGQAYLEEGEYAKARAAEEQVLAQAPDFVSAKNNLSLISWLEGDVEGAIATAKSVLETASNNIHALSNLVRFHVIAGDEAAAQRYAKALKDTAEEDAWNGWTKQVEGLSYLGDDEGVVEIYERWLKADSEIEQSDPFFNHLVAVALSRCDRLPEARRHWLAVIQSPSPLLTIAQQNLRETNLSIGERHGAWPFNLKEWLLPKTSEDFEQIMNLFKRTQNAGKLARSMSAFFDEHPEFVQQIPRILERGGPQGQTFLVLTSEQIDHPALLSAIKDFALSKNGPDSLRNQAATNAVEAGLMPIGESMTIWINGEWREVQRLVYEIYQEPETHNHSDAVVDLLTEALPLIYERNKKSMQKAEKLLKEALALEPDAPDVQFNLASAYLQQGKILKGEALIQEIHKRCPDYLFARVAIANFNIDAGNYSQAEALLEPLQKQVRFHTSEFDALMDTRIKLSMERKRYDVAGGWVSMWAQEAPEHPRVAYWRSHLALLQES